MAIPPRGMGRFVFFSHQPPRVPARIYSEIPPQTRVDDATINLSQHSALTIGQPETIRLLAENATKPEHTVVELESYLQLPLIV